MPGDDLTPSEAAILFVLMAEAREVSNTELRKRYGVDVRKSYRDKLNRLGLVDSRREGNTFLHQLADKGWVRVQEDLNFQSSQGRILGGALTALQVNLRDRVMGRSDYRTFGEMFALTDVRAGAAQPGRPARPYDLRIRQGYAALAAEPGAWVSLTRRLLRATCRRTRWTGRSRDGAAGQDVNLVPSRTRRPLTPADRGGGAHRRRGQAPLAIGA